MSFDIHIFRTETKNNELELQDDSFFENENNLVTFTEKQVQQLKERLLNYNYIQKEKNEHGLIFSNSKYKTDVLLTAGGLYFTSSWNEESMFEVGMTASEFTDTGEFKKYDPQNGGWEDI